MCIVCRHLQCTVQLCIMGQQLNNVGQCDFDVVIDGTRSGTRHGANEGTKFVLDPVDELVQQNAFYRDSWCEGEPPSLNAPIQHFDPPRPVFPNLSRILQRPGRVPVTDGYVRERNGLRGVAITLLALSTIRKTGSALVGRDHFEMAA
jgi:hypothetical protein